MTSVQERTRALNDELRIYHRGGRIMVTAGVQALGENMIRRLDEAIAAFDEFDEDSDPHGEHDFGVIEIEGKEEPICIRLNVPEKCPARQRSEPAR
jgi:hypothetical protein